MESQAALFCRELNFRNASIELRNRTGIIIRKRADSTHSWSYGEASPLESHSREDIHECLAWLSGEKLQEAPPSIQFALSTLKSWDEITSGAEGKVCSGALLGLDASSLELDRYLELGYRVFKIKISPKNVNSTLDLIRGAQGRCSDILFRLDANQSFETSNLSFLFQALNGLPIDYVEDPCVLSPEIIAMFREHKIPIAMDQQFDPNLPVEVAVIKPTVAGGEKEIIRLTEELRSRGRRVVFSSCLETEIGRAAIVRLARKLAGNEVHGVATGGFYAENFWPDSPTISTPVRFASGWQQWIDSLDWRVCEL